MRIRFVMKVRHINCTIKSYLVGVIAVISKLVENKDNMNTELSLFPRTIAKKSLLKSGLDRYIRADSVPQLYLALREYRREGLFDFEVRVSPDYVDQEDAIMTVKLRADVMIPAAPVWAFQQNSHGLARLYSSIKAKKALSEAEISEVITKFPADFSERFVQFKIIDVDWDMLREFVASQPVDAKRRSKNTFDVVEYRGLRIDGVNISYQGRSFHIRNGLKQALRLLMEKKGLVCTYDDFFDSYNSVFKHNANLSNPQATLRKLISEVRKELKPIIGYDCIVNDPETGWHLQIN